MNGIIKKTRTGEYEYGDFNRGPKVVLVFSRGRDAHVPAKCFDLVKDDVFFSLLHGVYYWKKDFSVAETAKHTNIMGVGLYPYSFDRAYEAVNHFDLFSGKESVENNFKFIGAEQLRYTFGLEYESSMGSVPEWMCFRDGLIPLRDGSISGAEYSTVVMEGNAGINLIYQQVETLRNHTAFNKECSLHMHFGGYPVSRKAIFTLYSLCSIVETQFFQLCNKFVVNTSRYKKSGKDYCKELKDYSTFEEMFSDITGVDYDGLLTNPHPADTDRSHKWNIHSRYYDINFVNMLCYRSPKTVEFRFLRPTYNFTKIYTWVLIFNAVLTYAEELSKIYGEKSPNDLFKALSKDNRQTTLKDIVKHVYDSATAKIINRNIRQLFFVSMLQASNEDFAGSDTSFEDRLMTDTYR